MIIDNSFMKEMMILLHSRGNSQALYDLEDFSNVIYLNKLNVVSRYDLSLKAERKVSNCNPDRSQTHECLKKFIASQMNCTTKWENKYFPDHYDSCKSKEELKSYLDIRLSIYQHLFDEQLKQCFQPKCYEQYGFATHFTDYNKELLNKMPIMQEFLNQSITALNLGINGMKVSI